MEKLLDASNLAQVVETLINLLKKTSSLGNVDRPVLLLHGRNEAMTEASTLVIPVHLDHLEVLRHGQEIVPVEMTIVVETPTMVAVVSKEATMLLLHLLLQLVAMLLRGHRQLLLTLLLQLVAMVATLPLAIPVATHLSNLWVRHLVSQLLLD